MGFFDAFRAPPRPEVGHQEAIMVVLVAAIMADGEAERSEIVRLNTICALSPIYRANTGAQDSAVLDAAVKRFQARGFDAVRESASLLPPPLRETAFALACELILADGIVSPDEEAFIEFLAEALQLQKELVMAVVHVSLIRNRGLQG